MRRDGGDGEGDGKMRRQGGGSALSFGHSHRRIWDPCFRFTLGLGNICLRFAGVGSGLHIILARYLFFRRGFELGYLL